MSRSSGASGPVRLPSFLLRHGASLSRHSGTWFPRFSLNKSKSLLPAFNLRCLTDENRWPSVSHPYLAFPNQLSDSSVLVPDEFLTFNFFIENSLAAELAWRSARSSCDLISASLLFPVGKAVCFPSRLARGWELRGDGEEGREGFSVP